MRDRCRGVNARVKERTGDGDGKAMGENFIRPGMSLEARIEARAEYSHRRAATTVAKTVSETSAFVAPDSRSKKCCSLRMPSAYTTHNTESMTYDRHPRSHEIL